LTSEIIEGHILPLFYIIPAIYYIHQNMITFCSS